MAKQAIQDNGDVGPNGKNLFKYWCEYKEKRFMLVAEKDVFAGDPSFPSKVVVRGTNSGVIFAADSTEETFPVWKMSVAAESRRIGTGARLLQEEEEWVVAHGRKRMRMNTANPIGSRFYQYHGCELMCVNRLAGWFGGWHEKQM